MSVEENLKDQKEVLSPSVLQSIDRIVKKEGYITYEKHTKVVNTGGNNSLGMLFEVDVKGETADGEKETNIFIKEIITEERSKAIDLVSAYLKESYVYTELFEMFNDLQTEAKVPNEERFNTVKSFYSDSDAIYLENMSKKGFRQLNRLELMPLKFAELSVQQLARFHGLSFVLQKKNPDYFERKLKPIKTAIMFNEDWTYFSKYCCLTAIECLNEDQKEKVRKFLPSVQDKYKQYAEVDTARCLCHWDYRQSNILYKEANGEISELIPIDYQLIHFGNPVTDFIFFIVNGTDQQFRRKHLTNLKNMYYDTLEQFLKYFDMDVNNVYSRKDFEKEYKENLDFGLIIALALMPLFFIASKNVAGLETRTASALKIVVDNVFKERLRGIVDDYEQWGYI